MTPVFHFHGVLDMEWPDQDRGAGRPEGAWSTVAVHQSTEQGQKHPVALCPRAPGELLSRVPLPQTVGKHCNITKDQGDSEKAALGKGAVSILGVGGGGCQSWLLPLVLCSPPLGKARAGPACLSLPIPAQKVAGQERRTSTQAMFR